jgi:imidazolonepropionase-like amidohydrolase
MLGSIVFVVLVGGPLFAQPASRLSEEARQFVSVDAPVVALVGVQVVDGTGAPPKAGQTVVIENGRIAAVGGAAEVALPPGAQRLELSGHTVIPGIVGMHNHTFYTTSKRESQMNVTSPRLYLASGVTTIRTTGSFSPYSEINLKRSIDNGEIAGPRMHVTGPYISGKGADTTMAQVTTPEDARRVVGYWADEGATWFKAYTLISRAELEAAIDEAHRRGLKFTAHLCSVTFREAVDLGIDGLEHGFFTNTEYDPDKKPDECPPTYQRHLWEEARSRPRCAT